MHRRRYAEFYGYDYVEFTDKIVKTDPPKWNKFAAIKAVMPNYDWVFWQDSDSMVVNFGRPLEAFMEPAPECTGLLLGCEKQGGSRRRYHDGDMLIRNSEVMTTAFALAEKDKKAKAKDLDMVALERVFASPEYSPYRFAFPYGVFAARARISHKYAFIAHAYREKDRGSKKDILTRWGKQAAKSYRFWSEVRKYGR